MVSRLPQDSQHVGSAVVPLCCCGEYGLAVEAVGTVVADVVIKMGVVVNTVGILESVVVTVSECCC